MDHQRCSLEMFKGGKSFRNKMSVLLSLMNSILLPHGEEWEMKTMHFGNGFGI